MGEENNTQEKIILNQINIAVASLKTTLHTTHRVAYISHFVTQGTRFLDLCEKYNVSTKEELNAIDPSMCKEKIMKPNLAQGLAFGKYVHEQGYITIVPGEFFAKEWLQKHYMSFWETVITEFAQSICFLKDFHTSPGGIEELVIARDKGCKLYIGKPLEELNIIEELPKIEAALERMQKLGVDYSRTEKAYKQLAQ